MRLHRTGTYESLSSISGVYMYMPNSLAILNPHNPPPPPPRRQHK